MQCLSGHWVVGFAGNYWFLEEEEFRSPCCYPRGLEWNWYYTQRWGQQLMLMILEDIFICIFSMIDLVYIFVCQHQSMPESTSQRWKQYASFFKYRQSIPGFESILHLLHLFLVFSTSLFWILSWYLLDK